jgi:histone deacetylase complex regulatory component SIN3
MENLRNHPKDTIPILIMRFKKKIEEVFNSKIEAEKVIKPQYEKFYAKSLDYRSLRYKNSEKKNNNAKAFVKEIMQRKKDKMVSNNINILKGGVENAEFFITINLKFFRENISKTLKQFQLDEYINNNNNKNENEDFINNNNIKDNKYIDIDIDNDKENENKNENDFFNKNISCPQKLEKDFSDVLLKNINKIE